MNQNHRINAKKKLIYKILESVNRKKQAHKKRSMKFKHIDNILEGCLIACSTVTLSSIVLQYMDANPAVMLVSAVFSSKHGGQHSQKDNGHFESLGGVERHLHGSERPKQRDNDIDGEEPPHVGRFGQHPKRCTPQTLPHRRQKPVDTNRRR